MDAFEQECKSTMQVMGFGDDDINRAWTKSDIKTIEGMIIYLEQHPEPQGFTTPAPAPVPLNNSNPIQAPNPHAMDIEESAPEQPKVLENKNVNKYVKKELVDELVKLGYVEFIAEKAVLLSGNKDLETALRWIEEHKNDADFNEPVEVEAPKSTLTPEEARAKAKELQAMLRQKAKEREEQDKLDQEKLRMRMGKELAETRRIQEEQQKKRDLEAYLAEKNKTEKEKEDMTRLLEEEKKMRLGDKYKPKEVKKQSPRHAFEDVYFKMYKIYRMGQHETLKTCIKTLKIYVDNILKDPSNEKFRMINADNPNFCQRVKDVIGGSQILNLLGFKEEGGVFRMDSPDVPVLTELRELLSDKFDSLNEL